MSSFCLNFPAQLKKNKTKKKRGSAQPLSLKGNPRKNSWMVQKRGVSWGFSSFIRVEQNAVSFMEKNKKFFGSNSVNS